MSRSLLIGNLSLETEEGSIISLFSKAGSVQHVEIVIDPGTGRKKGFAFVEMSSEAEAQRAMKQLEGFEINGRSISINKTESLQEKAGLSLIARFLKCFGA